MRLVRRLPSFDPEVRSSVPDVVRSYTDYRPFTVALESVLEAYRSERGTLFYGFFGWGDGYGLFFSPPHQPDHFYKMEGTQDEDGTYRFSLTPCGLKARLRDGLMEGAGKASGLVPSVWEPLKGTERLKLEKAVKRGKSKISLRNKKILHGLPQDHFVYYAIEAPEVFGFNNYLVVTQQRYEQRYAKTPYQAYVVPADIKAKDIKELCVGGCSCSMQPGFSEHTGMMLDGHGFSAYSEAGWRGEIIRIDGKEVKSLWRQEFLSVLGRVPHVFEKWTPLVTPYSLVDPICMAVCRPHRITGSVYPVINFRSGKIEIRP